MQEWIGRLQELLFSSCTGLLEQCLNASTKVQSVLIAYFVRYYPQLKVLASASPIITRVEEYLVAADMKTAALLAWFVALSEEEAVSVQELDQTQKEARISRNGSPLSCHS